MFPTTLVRADEFGYYAYLVATMNKYSPSANEVCQSFYSLGGVRVRGGGASMVGGGMCGGGHAWWGMW